MLLGDHELAQGVKVSTQDCQGHVAFEAHFTNIAAAEQSVTRLQGFAETLPFELGLTVFAHALGSVPIVCCPHIRQVAES